MKIQCGPCDGIGFIYALDKSKLVKCTVCGGTGQREESEHGPIAPSPMIDAEIMAEYRRSVDQFESRKEMPR